MKKSINTLLVFAFLPFSAVGQFARPEDKAIIFFRPTVTVVASGVFDYLYTVSSSTFSQGVFSNFSLAISDQLLQQNRTEIIGPTTKKWYIDGDPQGLISGAAANRFVGIPPENGLMAGESMNVSFISRGLPWIKAYYAHSYAAPYTPEDLDSLRAAGFTEQQLFPDWRDNSFKGLTIAPHVVDSSMRHISFLDTLLSYTRQSAELGWLGRERDNDCDNDERPEDGIVRNIEQRLKKVKRQLERRDSVLARRELEKLVGKVDRLWKRSQEDDKKDKRDRWEKRDKVVITSEAYALLKYNTEYLIDRLPDRKPKKGSKEKD